VQSGVKNTLPALARAARYWQAACGASSTAGTGGCGLRSRRAPARIAEAPLNIVESFFGIITRQAIRRGSYASVRALIDPIGRFIDAWNDRRESVASQGRGHDFGEGTTVNQEESQRRYRPLERAHRVRIHASHGCGLIGLAVF
jgi:hypothetical protein